MLSALITQYILPTAVVVSAAATTTSAAIAWKLYQSVEQHERVLFGEDSIDTHEGILTAVHENQRRSERNRRILNDEGYIDSERER